MVRSRRPSKQMLALLEALSAQPREWRHGYDLMKETGLLSGTLYPLLLDALGLVLGTLPPFDPALDLSRRLGRILGCPVLPVVRRRHEADVGQGGVHPAGGAAQVLGDLLAAAAADIALLNPRALMTAAPRVWIMGTNSVSSQARSVMTSVAGLPP